MLHPKIHSGRLADGDAAVAAVARPIGCQGECQIGEVNKDRTRRKASTDPRLSWLTSGAVDLIRRG